MRLLSLQTSVAVIANGHFSLRFATVGRYFLEANVSSTPVAIFSPCFDVTCGCLCVPWCSEVLLCSCFSEKELTTVAFNTVSPFAQPSTSSSQMTLCTNFSVSSRNSCSCAHFRSRWFKMNSRKVIQKPKSVRRLTMAEKEEVVKLYDKNVRFLVINWLTLTGKMLSM